MIHTRSARTGALFIIGAGGLWGTIGVIAQWLSDDGLSAISTGFWRFSMAAVVLLSYSLWRMGWRGLFRLPQRDAGLVFANGFFLAASQTLYIAAIPMVGVTISTLVTICVAPLIVVMFGLVSGGGRPNRSVIAALIAALLGTALLMADSHASSGGTDLISGTILSLAAAGTYAGVVLCGHRLTQRCAPLHINTLSFALGALMLGGVGLFTGIQTPSTVGGWGLVVYLGVFPSVIAYGLFLMGMRAVSAEVASILTLTEPLAAALLAAWVFSESLTAWGWVGAGLMCVGFVLTLRTPERAA